MGLLAFLKAGRGSNLPAGGKSVCREGEFWSGAQVTWEVRRQSCWGSLTFRKLHSLKEGVNKHT